MFLLGRAVHVFIFAFHSVFSVGSRESQDWASDKAMYSDDWVDPGDMLSTDLSSFSTVR